METSHTAVEARLLEAALRPGSTVLEAGCGRTTRLADHRDRIDRLVGVDVDVAAGRQNAALDEFIAADLGAPLPFEDGTFDLVYANFVVEHLAEPGHTFAEWRRVLRVDGGLVLLTSNSASPFMATARALPQAVRVAVKRGGAGAAERDIFPALYRANTPRALAALTAAAGFVPVALHYVATLHRYGARVPPLAWLLRGAEQVLPLERRSTIVASYRAV